MRKNHIPCLLFMLPFILEPSPPGELISTTVDSISMSFVYSKPVCKNGIITHQEIEYTHLPYNVCAVNTGTNMNIVEHMILPVNMSDEIWTFSLKDLKPFWKYSIRVRVNTSAGFSNFSETISPFRTHPSSKYISWTYQCIQSGFCHIISAVKKRHTNFRSFYLHYILML